MIKIRLSFTTETEKEEAIRALSDSFNLISISKNYKNLDGLSFRVYVDAEMIENKESKNTK